MLEYKPGCLARSLAGHDKDRYFIILEEDGEYVALADGKGKTVAHPKWKKKKHIQLVKEPLIRAFPVTDETIRKAIVVFRRKEEHVESRCN